MEISYLVDHLEEVVSGALRVPFGKIVLDEQVLLEIIDHMRLAQPDIVNQARRVMQQREQIITQAQAEAERIVMMARDRVAHMLTDDGLVLESKAAAERILAEARREADTLRQDADAYAAEVLTQLEAVLDTHIAILRTTLTEQATMLERSLSEVRAGIAELR